MLEALYHVNGMQPASTQHTTFITRHKHTLYATQHTPCIHSFTLAVYNQHTQANTQAHTTQHIPHSTRHLPWPCWRRGPC